MNKKDVELLDYWFNEFSERFKGAPVLKALVEQFKKERLIFVPLKFDRWIVDDDVPNWIAKYDKQKNIIYGINYDGVWFESILNAEPPLGNDDKNRYATKEEIKELFKYLKEI